MRRLLPKPISASPSAPERMCKRNGQYCFDEVRPSGYCCGDNVEQGYCQENEAESFWAAIYNVLAIPVAAGVFYNSLGWQLRPEISALLMSVSSIIVATNAVLLKRIEPKLKAIGNASVDNI